MRRRPTPLLRLTSAEDTWRALEGLSATPDGARMQRSVPAPGPRGSSPPRRYGFAAERHRRQQVVQLTTDVQLGTTGMLKFELPHHAEDRIMAERARRWAETRERRAGATHTPQACSSQT